MMGSHVGTLSVQIKTSTSPWTTLWSKTGAQTSSSTGWTEAIITISPDVRRLRFVGQTSSSWQGDMAIDDLVFAYSGATTAAPPTTTNTLSGTGGGGGGGGTKPLVMD